MTTSEPLTVYQKYAEVLLTKEKIQYLLTCCGQHKNKSAPFLHTCIYNLEFDSIVCDASLHFTKTECRITITHDWLQICLDENDEDELHEYTLYHHTLKFASELDFTKRDEFAERIKQAYEHMKLLTFTKRTGDLMTKQNAEWKQLEFDAFQDIKRNSKCSVCLECTYTTTSCKHALCLACWTNLVKMECPLCRHPIPHYIKK